MQRTTVNIPDELREDIESYLDYSDTMSEFFADAAREKLDREKAEA